MCVEACTAKVVWRSWWAENQRLRLRLPKGFRSLLPERIRGRHRPGSSRWPVPSGQSRSAGPGASRKAMAGTARYRRTVAFEETSGEDNLDVRAGFAYRAGLLVPAEQPVPERVPVREDVAGDSNRHWRS